MAEEGKKKKVVVKAGKKSDSGEKKKIRPYLEYSVTEPYSFSFKPEKMLNPTIYVRYVNEYGEPVAISDDDIGFSLSDEGLGTMLTGIPDIAKFQMSLLPYLIASGKISDNVGIRGNAKYIDDKSRAEIKNNFAKALDGLSDLAKYDTTDNIVGGVAGQDDMPSASSRLRALNNVLAKLDGMSLNPDFDLGLGLQYEDDGSGGKIYHWGPDMQLLLSSIKDGSIDKDVKWQEPNIEKQVRWWLDHGNYSTEDYEGNEKNFIRAKVDEELARRREWNQRLKSVRDELESIGATPDQLEAIVKYKNAEDKRDRLLDLEKKERTFAHVLSEALKVGDLSQVWGPVAGYRQKANVLDHLGYTDDSEPIMEKRDDEKQYIFPSQALDVLDFNSPFMRGLYDLGKLLGELSKVPVSERSSKLNESFVSAASDWNNRMRGYLKNALKFKYINDERDKEYDPNIRGSGKKKGEKDVVTYSTIINPADLLSMGPEYVGGTFDHLAKSKGKAFRGILEAGNEEFNNLWKVYNTPRGHIKGNANKKKTSKGKSPHKDFVSFVRNTISDMVKEGSIPDGEAAAMRKALTSLQGDGNFPSSFEKAFHEAKASGKSNDLLDLLVREEIRRRLKEEENG